MTDTSRDRITSLYAGPAGDLWERIGLERPQGYWEENVVLGRRRVTRTLLEWMEPAAGRRVLDLGCGCGTTALELARRRFDITGVDLVERFITQARSRHPGEPRPSFRVGDFREQSWDGTPFHDLLLLEILEDYLPNERWPLLRHLAESEARRLYLALRLAAPWHDLLGALWPEGLSETLDPVPLLRWIHLQTSYRLTRQREIKRRNYQVKLIELSRDPLNE